MNEFIEIKGEKYPVLFDTWALIHLQKAIGKNVFKYLQENPEGFMDMGFLLDMTYSGIYGGLDIEDESDMPFTRKELARKVTITDFEKIVTMFGTQLTPEKKPKAVKKATP